MPGKVLQNMSKAAVKNPLFLLDEVDKMGADFRGDPSSALLEVLDPEQNHSFIDHYAEVEFDLSDVMFVATANSLNIPPALLHRMEIIRLAGYTEDEKVNIATKYLLPKQMKANGVQEGELAVQETALRDIVRYYTREAGVRSLHREIAKICRKVVTSASLKAGKAAKVTVSGRNLDKYLGVRRFDYGIAEDENRIGQVTGLAYRGGWRIADHRGGVAAGQGQYHPHRPAGRGDAGIHHRGDERGAQPRAFAGHQAGLLREERYAHPRAGRATPKDGPSAGIAMTTALVSVLTGIPVRADVAMTGEITLRGEVLPIGGLKEKLLAAHRGGIKHVLIPKGNEKIWLKFPPISSIKSKSMPLSG